MAAKPRRASIKYESILEIREDVRKAKQRNRDKLVMLSLDRALEALDRALGEKSLDNNAVKR